MVRARSQLYGPLPKIVSAPPDRGVAIALNYDYYRRVRGVIRNDKPSVMTRTFSQTLIAEDSTLSRLTNLKVVFLEPILVATFSLADRVADYRIFRRERDRTRQDRLTQGPRNSTGRFAVFAWIHRNARAARFCSTPSPRIWQSYNFTNVDMRTDRQARCPTTVG